MVKLYLAKRQVRDSSYPTLASSLVVETLFDNHSLLEFAVLPDVDVCFV